MREPLRWLASRWGWADAYRFWMKVFNSLRNRGVADILIAVTDGLKGFAEALEAVFPATTLQTCIVHLIRNSLEYASWKERRELAAALKPIYTAVDAQAAEAELTAFEQGPWGERYPTVAQAWRRAWVDSGRSVREWRQAMNQFAIAFGDRFTRYVV